MENKEIITNLIEIRIDDIFKDVQDLLGVNDGTLAEHYYNSVRGKELKKQMIDFFNDYAIEEKKENN